MATKVSDKDFKDAYELHSKTLQKGELVEKLKEVLQMSGVNVYYRIRQLGLSGQQKPDATTVATASINKEDIHAEEITDILKTEIKDSDLIPAVNPEYKTRTLDAIVRRYADRTTPVLLIGEAGTGKTETARQLAAELRLPFLRVACDDSAVLKEFIGRRELINGNTVFRTGLLIELCQRPSVILIDEFNALPASRLFFLHEMLDNRRIFIKDAKGGECINLHPDCRILLACNPNGAKYSGTNKINVALVDRCAVVNVPELNPDDFAELFDCKNKKNTENLKRFYCEVKRVVNEQNLRVAFSIRAVKRIADGLRNGDQIAEALAYGFYNSAYVTATDKERDALEQIAKVCFGMNAYNNKTEEI